MKHDGPGYEPAVNAFELIVVLLAAAIPLVLLANRIAVAYPIVLVVAGLAIGFVPGIPAVSIPPDLILVIFLPPLLYSQAVGAPTRAFRIFATPILRLALGLVIVTAAGVAFVAHGLVPGLGWAAAAAFGAVVAPTDEVAFVAIAERMQLPQRIRAIVQGESLLNDASALVLFAVALEAATSGRFSLPEAALRLVWTCVASVALGLAVGFAIVRAFLVVRESMLEVLLTLLAGYIAYIPARHLGLSGVLATITTGFYVARFAPREIEPKSRILNRGAWAVLIFVLNATIFIVVGLQLRPIAAALRGDTWLALFGYAVAVNAAIVGLRVLWMMAFAYPFDRYVRSRAHIPPWRIYAVLSWCGMRGGVSLAAALAIPTTLAHGVPFPHRSLLIFLTFSVILTTLVVQGTTLPAVLRVLRVGGDEGETAEEDQALLTATKASLRELERLVAEGRVESGAATVLRERYEKHVLDEAATGEVRTLYRAEEELLAVQNAVLAGMRDRGEIENTTMRALQTQLDFKRVQLAEEIDRRSEGEDA